MQDRGRVVIYSMSNEEYVMTGAKVEMHADDAQENDEQVYADIVLETILNGATLKDLHGISPEMMEGVYTYAYDFYNQGRLDDAEIFFRFLCIYDFYNADYALGLGAVYQLKRNYHKAIDVYGLAYTLGDRDYRPMLYAGQCNLLLKRKGKARQCFETVIEDSDDESLKACASIYLQGMANASVKT